MSSLKDRFETVSAQIDAAATAAGRDPASIALLAVSKRQPVDAIADLATLGQRRFGENFVQEARDKIDVLAGHELEWHFIGRLQSNKTREVAENFDWVHSVDRLRIARRLNDQRPDDAPPLNVCVEVNISGEAAKGGVTPSALPGFIDEVAALTRLRLRGLMTLPAPEPNFEHQRAAFRRLAECHAGVGLEGFDTLSMGTTGDFAAAIMEGATIVRIGTALFGSRDA